MNKKGSSFLADNLGWILIGFLLLLALLLMIPGIRQALFDNVSNIFSSMR